MQTYHGNCHCGKFKFSIDLPPIQSLRNCNCSICLRNGYLFIIVKDDQLKIEKGYEGLKTYQFAKHVRSHKFCPNCGTSAIVLRHDEMDGHAVGINVRVFNNTDFEAIPKEETRNGASRDPRYQPPKAPFMLDDPHSDLKVYSGNCHCGKVRYSVKTKPLTEVKVMSCNCSLCSRNGDLWIYPKKSEVVIEGEDALTGYEFLHDDSLHSFCSDCGVSMFVDVRDEDIMPINVRTINSIDVDGLILNRYDGKKNDPQYVM